jgi:hypothetical protein
VKTLHWVASAFSAFVTSFFFDPEQQQAPILRLGLRKGHPKSRATKRLLLQTFSGPTGCFRNLFSTLDLCARNNTTMSAYSESEAVAKDFREALEDIQTIGRPEISNLTIIARENIEHALAISGALVDHIKRVGSKVFLARDL